MYNSSKREKYNSKVAERKVRTIDPAMDMEYQRLVGGMAFQEPDEQRRGLRDIGDSSDMWANNLKHWSSGNYPTTDHLLPGLLAAPHKEFSTKLENLQSLAPGEREIFHGIKHYDSGRHFDIHVVRDPGTSRLKASVHIPSDTTGTVDYSNTNLHGNHVFDIESGVWHPRGESHEGPSAISSYNPMELLQNAPADYADNTNEWVLPNSSLGFCKTCRRFPKALSKMLDLMRPTRCTVCGEVGVPPEHGRDQGQFPSGAETGAMRQPVTLVCGTGGGKRSKEKCSNYGKSIASEPAFVDNDFNVIYPGKESSQERKIFQFTPETLEHHTNDLDYKKTEKRDNLRKQWASARELGDLSENEEYKSVVRAIQSNESKIKDLEHQLNPANYEMIDKIPDAYLDHEGNPSSIPYRSVYDNPKFNESLGKLGRNFTKILLPMRNLECDHEDCADHGKTIHTKNSLEPVTDLPCVHCNRKESDGVSIAVDPSGYARCNPAEYGANNCAPLPDGVDAESYIGWKKPNPDFKFPTARSDAETGVGTLIQRTPEEQDRNNPMGLYPGTQRILMRNPLSISRVRNNVESLKNYFTFGKTTPWAPLGMAGRKFADKRPDLFTYKSPEAIDLATKQSVIPAQWMREQLAQRGINNEDHPDYAKASSEIESNYGSSFAAKILNDIREEERKSSLNLSGEKIKPEDYRSRVRTPIIGDVSDILDNSIELSDSPDSTMPGVEFRDNGVRSRPKKLLDKFPGVEGLSEEDYHEALGFNPDSVDSTGNIITRLLGKFQQNRALYPVEFGADRKVKRTSAKISKIVSPEGNREFGGQLVTQNPWDIDNNLDTSNIGFEHPEEFLPERTDENEEALVNFGIDAPEQEPCTVCDGNSIYNKKGFFKFYDNHCKSCKTTKCGTHISSQNEHCDNCKKKDKGCSGRRRYFFKSKDHVCPKCGNEGIITNTLPNGSQESENNPLGEAPATESMLMDRVKENLIDPRIEGLDLEDQKAIDFAKNRAAVQRSRDVDYGLILEQKPEERELGNLKSVGPVILMRDRGSELDKGLIESLREDIGSMAKQSPRYEGQEPGSTFDSVSNLARIEALGDLDPGIDYYEGEKPSEASLELARMSPAIINGTPVPRIEHDLSCKLCNRGIVIPSKVGPEEMARRNGIIGEGVARIKRTVADSDEQLKQIAQLQADAYKCEGQ